MKLLLIIKLVPAWWIYSYQNIFTASLILQKEEIRNCTYKIQLYNFILVRRNDDGTSGWNPSKSPFIQSLYNQIHQTL